MKYEIHEMKIVKGKIIADKKLQAMEEKKMYTPGTIIKVKGRNRRIRCVDNYETHSNIIVE